MSTYQANFKKLLIIAYIIVVSTNLWGQEIGYQISSTGNTYKTIDSGVSWNLVGDLVNTSIAAASFVSENIGYQISSTGNTYKTIDSGVSWNLVGDLVNTSIVAASFINSGALSVNEIEVEKKALIYPNPNEGDVSVNFNDLKDVIIKVYDIGGKLVYQKTKVSGIIQFKLNGPPGLYIIGIISQSDVEYFKLIKK